MKKNFVILACVIIAVTAIILYRGLDFSYVNPYTNTSGCAKIAPTIKVLANGLDYAKKHLKNQGLEINYLFWNAYGSGFMKNNPIPNDLDFAVGIDLGEYDYNGKNGQEIAGIMDEKMKQFTYAFNYYIAANTNKQFYSTLKLLEPLQKKSVYKYSIANYLDKAISGKEYIYPAKKYFEDKEGSVIIPYTMRSNELLLEEYRHILLFSDKVFYNDKMPEYMREVSVIPDFFATINHNGKKTRIELVPESYLGARLQLKRRFFASNIFIGKFSEKYLQNLDFMQNDEEYYFYRMFSFRRHMEEVEMIVKNKIKPVKLIKRIMQTSSMVSPVLGEEKYNEISEFVNNKLSNPEIQLLNEYENICRNILSIMEYTDLYLELSHDGKIAAMYEQLGKVMTEINNSFDLTPDAKKVLNDFYNIELKSVLLPEKLKDIQKYRLEVVKPQFTIVTEKLNQEYYKRIGNEDKINEYLNLFDSIFINAGYHKCTFGLIDDKTVAILEDDFTSQIKDLNKFALDNGLADMNYKLVHESNFPQEQFCYVVWVRYNPTEEQQENYKNLRKMFEDDKKNFNLKRKFVLF